jgi:aspartate aminotransferase
MAALARELKAQGKDIISLSLGEPDFNTPDFIKKLLKKAIDRITYHRNKDGKRRGFAVNFKRDNNLEYKPRKL